MAKLDFIKIRVDESEREKYNKLAKDLNTNLSQLIRDLLNDKALEVENKEI